MPPLKNIALIGASGDLGSHILEKLQASGQFNIRVLRRPTSHASFPPTVKVIDVLLDDVESLTEALRDQDAVVSALGTSQIPQQEHLAEACIRAGVQRLIPAEFGADIPNLKVQSLPTFHPHTRIHKAVIEACETSSLTYTFVHNGVFLDWGIEHGFMFGISDYKPLIIDDGNLVCSATTVTSIADAVVGILNNPSETRNRDVYIEDIKLTQNKFYELAKKAAPSKPWEFKYAKLDDLTAGADTEISQWKRTEQAAVPYLYRALLDPEYGGSFTQVDNELLGLKGKTEGDVIEIIKRYIK